MAKNPYDKIYKNLTDSERRELSSIEKRTDRMFRNFWIKAMKRQGWTNTAIAEEWKITESTVRSILQKEEAA